MVNIRDFFSITLKKIPPTENLLKGGLYNQKLQHFVRFLAVKSM